MKVNGPRRWALSLPLALSLLSGSGSVPAQVPDKFKNLQVFPKEMSKPDLLDAMKGFSMSLGVRCTYCHVGEDQPGPQPFANFKFDADDKPPKGIARSMVKMMSDINSRYLSEIKTGRDEKVQVSCMTCRRGVAIPKPIEQIILDAVTEKGADAGVKRYRDLRAQYPDGTMAYSFGEEPLHEVARVLRAGNKVDDAITIETLTAEFHPRSARAWFTLGELFADKGDKVRAADSYRRALEISPDMEPAKKRLADLAKPGS